MPGGFEWLIDVRNGVYLAYPTAGWRTEIKGNTKEELVQAMNTFFEKLKNQNNSGGGGIKGLFKALC
jgi:hypothetical protein